jgi:hypothetical protein
MDRGASVNARKARKARPSPVLDTDAIAIASVVSSALDCAHAAAYEPAIARAALASIEAFRVRQTSEPAARILAAIHAAIAAEVQA